MVDDLETTLTRYFRLAAPPGLVDRALRSFEVIGGRRSVVSDRWPVVGDSDL